MKEQLKSYIPKWLKNLRRELLDVYAVKSYSQEGEDMILRRIFEKDLPSFYVDVGAHHPKRFSNTFYFYKRGWHGINIDAMPGSMEPFRRARPRDINIEAAVGNDKRELTFFIYNEPALNTFDENLVKQWDSAGYRLIERKKIVTVPLRDILEKHLPSGTKIKFMSIDVQGLDLEVVRSNDWELYRPEYVLVESSEKTVSEIRQGQLHQFMVQQQYDFFSKSVLTLIFKDGRLAQ